MTVKVTVYIVTISPACGKLIMSEGKKCEPWERVHWENTATLVFFVCFNDPTTTRGSNWQAINEVKNFAILKGGSRVTRIEFILK